MTSSFQTELRDRAATHAGEWEASRDPSVGLAEVGATVRRRRRGRGLLAVAGCAVAVAALAGVAYAVAGGGLGMVAGHHGSGNLLDALAGVGEDSVVLSMAEELPNPGYGSTYGVVIIDGADERIAKFSSAEVSSALGAAAEGWPVVTLVALDRHLDRAVFQLDSPMALTTSRVAIVNLATGDVQVEDPCASTLNSIDVSRWCASAAPGGAVVVIDPTTGKVIQVPAFEACEGANSRFGGKVVASCGSIGYESYLVSLDPATGNVVDQTPLGLAPIQSPLVVGDSLYINTYTTDGDPVLVDRDGNSPIVGGASVAGLAVMGDRLLVQTGSDSYAPPSTYGTSIGLWSPSTGEFTKLYGLSDGEAWSVTVVPALP